MRSKDPTVALLRCLPTLGGYPDNELANLAALLDPLTVEPGTILMEEGGHATDVFIIVEGLAVVSRRGRPVAKLGPGEFLSEMGVLDLASRSARVVAETRMRLLKTDARRFFTLADHAGIARALAIALAKRLRFAEAASG